MELYAHGARATASQVEVDESVSCGYKRLAFTMSHQVYRLDVVKQAFEAYVDRVSNR